MNQRTVNMMTNERAIKKLSMLKMVAVNAGTETAEAVDMAIELLKEKENPWRFFNFRKATEEEKKYYKEEYGEYNEGDADELEMIENVPGNCEEVLLWTGYGFSVDTYDDGMFEGAGEVEKGMAWRYLPEPPKEDDTH